MPATLTVTLSVDEADSPLNVAAACTRSADIGEQNILVGNAFNVLRALHLVLGTRI